MTSLPHPTDEIHVGNILKKYMKLRNKTVSQVAEEENQDTRDEIYSLIADNYNFLNDPKEGIKWLDKILKESKNESLLDHTKKTKKAWLETI